MFNISIIIPVYNVEKYIERCLSSVMRQGIFKGDVECILVDDCTPDKSIIIAQKMIESYEGPILFRIIHHLENQGLSCARNNGLLSAKGDYVLFLDSDDDIANDCLLCLSKELYNHDCVVDMVIGNSYDSRMNKFWQDQKGPSCLLRSHIDIMRCFLETKIPMMAWNKLIRREFLLENNLLFTPRMIHEDELWSFKLYDLVSSVVLIPEVTYNYEQNEESIMESPLYTNRRVKAYHTLTNMMLISLDKRELYVEKFFWGIQMFMRAEEIIINQKIIGELKAQNQKIGRDMFKRSLDDGRLAISFFLLLIAFPPFKELVRFGWFRHRYHTLRSFFKGLALN